MDIFTSKVTRLSIDIAAFKHFAANAYYKSIESRLLWANDQLIEDMQMHPKDIIGKNDIEVLGKDGAKKTVYNDQQVIVHQRTVVAQENRMIGRPALYHSVKMPCYDNDGQLTGVFGISIEVPNMDPKSTKNFQNEAYLSALSMSSELAQRLRRPNIQLTKREIEVLTKTVLGLTAAETADELHISKRTVEGHIENIKNKTGCMKKSEMIKFAIKNRLIILHLISKTM